MKQSKWISNAVLALVMFAVGGVLALSPLTNEPEADAETYRWVGERQDLKLTSVSVNGDEVKDLTQYYPGTESSFDVIAEPQGLALRNKSVNSIFVRDDEEMDR